MQLTDNLRSISGVGEKLETLLRRLGLSNIQDLLLDFPRTYNDYSKVTSINKLVPGKVTIMARVESVHGRYSRRGLHVAGATLADKTGRIKAVWFNQPYLSGSIPKGEQLFFSGEFALGPTNLSLQNPVWERVSDFTTNTARIVPIYRETKGITSRQIRRLLSSVRPVIGNIPDVLPCSAYGLNRAMAIEKLHFPDSTEDIDIAKTYFGYEEFFVLLCASTLAKREYEASNAPTIKFDEGLAKRFIATLPYRLTDSQRAAAWQLIQDLESTKAANRLIQGDVGSGKTVVAALASLMAVKNDFQVSVIAPTEILARQHYKNFTSMLSLFDIDVELLVGGQTAKERQDILHNIEDGTAHIVVGTHALLTDKVHFANLGFSIIDEQHRFGVKQREKLQQKSHKMPHLLSLSATPIPRSLALTVYGELDVSSITEMPPGRKPIMTEIVRQSTRDDVYKKIDAEIEAGRQVYVVCPLVEESDTLGIKSATQEQKRLQKSFAKRSIGLLHGKLKPAEKETVMQAFGCGDIDMLVSTTVVEVGVDVPNATIMLIEGAERFGLAQLHQLRGRVGRGGHQGYCFLSPSNDQYIGKRLRAIATTNDGFKLAELDLELRGAGAIYGLAQHGKLDLRFAKLTDTKLIAKVQSDVKDFLDSDDVNRYSELMKRIQDVRSITQLN